MRDVHQTPVRRRAVSVWSVGFTAFVTLVAMAVAAATLVAGLTGTTHQDKPVGLMSIEPSTQRTAQAQAESQSRADAPSAVDASKVDRSVSDAPTNRDGVAADQARTPTVDQTIDQSASPQPAQEQVEQRAPRRSRATHDGPTFDGRRLEKVRDIKMTVTAYSPDARSCGKWADGQTASGYSVWTNGMRLVAADTDLLPFKTIVTVPGYNKGKPVQVLDRGGAIKGKRLDVLYGTHERALQWGRQNVTITVWKYAD